MVRVFGVVGVSGVGLRAWCSAPQPHGRALIPGEYQAPTVGCRFGGPLLVPTDSLFWHYFGGFGCGNGVSPRGPGLGVCRQT